MVFNLLPSAFADFVFQELHLKGVEDSKIAALSWKQHDMPGFLSSSASLLGEDEHSVGVKFGRHVAQTGAELLTFDQTSVLPLTARSLPELVDHLTVLDLLFWESDEEEPEIWVENVQPHSFELHFISPNAFHAPWIEGLVDQLARESFGLQNLSIGAPKPADNPLGPNHAYLAVSVAASQTGFSDYCQERNDLQRQAEKSLFSLSAPDFYQLFPFHLVLDDKCQVLQAGSVLRRLFPALAISGACPASDFFQIHHPQNMPWSFDRLAPNGTKMACLLQSAQGLELRGSFIRTTMTAQGTEGFDVCWDNGLTEVALFMGTVSLDSISEMKRAGMCLADLPQHDLSEDFMFSMELRREDALEFEKKVKAVAEDRDSVVAACTRMMAGAKSEMVPSFFGNPVAPAVQLIDKLLLAGGCDVASLQELVHIREMLLKAGLSTEQTQTFDISSKAFDQYTGGDEEVNQGLMDLLVNQRERPSRADSLFYDHGEISADLDTIREHESHSVDMSCTRAGRADGGTTQSFDEICTSSEKHSLSPCTSAGRMRETDIADLPKNHWWSQVNLDRRPSLMGSDNNAEQKRQLSISTSRNAEPSNTGGSPRESLYLSSSGVGFPNRNRLSMKQSASNPNIPAIDQNTSSSPKVSTTASKEGSAKLEKEKGFLKNLSMKVKEIFSSTSPRGKAPQSAFIRPIRQSAPGNIAISGLEHSHSCDLQRNMGSCKGLEDERSMPGNNRTCYNMPLPPITIGSPHERLVAPAHKDGSTSAVNIRNSSPTQLPATLSTSSCLSGSPIHYSPDRSYTPNVPRVEENSTALEVQTLSAEGSSCRRSTPPRRLSGRLSIGTSSSQVVKPRLSRDIPGSVGSAAPIQHTNQSPTAVTDNNGVPPNSASPSGALAGADSGCHESHSGSDTEVESPLIEESTQGTASAARGSYNSSNSISNRHHKRDLGRVIKSRQSSKAIDLCMMMKSPDDEVLKILEHVDDWTFDMFALQKATKGRTLSVLAFHLFKRADIVSRLNLDEHRLARFLVRIEDGYPPNPYHCQEHAADVLRLLHVIATRGGVLHQVAPSMLVSGDITAVSELGESRGPRLSAVGTLSSKTIDMVRIAPKVEALSFLIIYLAAVVHDFEHKGVNNQFLIQTGDPLALLYNDASPMENHHVAASFSLLKEQRYNFLEVLPTKACTAIRTQVIDMVLSTDMKQHFGLVALFQSKTALTIPPASPLIGRASSKHSSTLNSHSQPGLGLVSPTSLKATTATTVSNAATGGSANFMRRSSGAGIRMKPSFHEGDCSAASDPGDLLFSPVCRSPMLVGRERYTSKSFHRRALVRLEAPGHSGNWFSQQGSSRSFVRYNGRGGSGVGGGGGGGGGSSGYGAANAPQLRKGATSFSLSTSAGDSDPGVPTLSVFSASGAFSLIGDNRRQMQHHVAWDLGSLSSRSTEELVVRSTSNFGACPAMPYAPSTLGSQSSDGYIPSVPCAHVPSPIGSSSNIGASPTVPYARAPVAIRPSIARTSIGRSTYRGSAIGFAPNPSMARTSFGLSSQPSSTTSFATRPSIARTSLGLSPQQSSLNSTRQSMAGTSPNQSSYKSIAASIGYSLMFSTSRDLSSDARSRSPSMPGSSYASKEIPSLAQATQEDDGGQDQGPSSAADSKWSDSTKVTAEDRSLGLGLLTKSRLSLQPAALKDSNGEDQQKAVDSAASPEHASAPDREESARESPDGAAELSNPEISPEFMSLVWKMALKCADLSNLANARPVARKWVLLLEEEMFRQGDRERAAGLPVSALMDREKAGVTKSQPGFFNVVALPLFSAFVKAYPATAPMLEGAKDNLAMWNAEGPSGTS